MASSRPEPGAKAGSGGARLIRRWLGSPEFSVVIVLVLLWTAIGLRGQGGSFWSAYTQETLFRSIGLQAIFAIGVLVVIITGGIDLSLGSMIAFGSMLLAVVATRLLDAGQSPGTSALIGTLVVLVFSVGLGALHASLVHHLRLPSFVVTLGSMSILRSASRLLNDSVPLPVQDFPDIIRLGNEKLQLIGTPLAIPIPTAIMLALAAAMAAVLGFTRIGRQTYSVGSNEEAARLSGVSVWRVRLFAYGVCSVLAGVAAVLYAGYGQQGDPEGGLMFELNGISAVVIGGGVLTGGRGSVAGTVLGVMLLESILTAINFTVDKPALWRGTVVGSVLLMAVVLNRLRQIRAQHAGARP